MNYTGEITNISLDYKTRKPIVSLLLNCESGLDELKDSSLDIKLDKHKNKRSLNANSYAWVLMQQLADKLNKPVIEIYKHYIREQNVYQDVTINKEATSTLRHSWGLNGLAWISEIVEHKELIDIVRLWYGSSSYNSRQMAKLIDNIVQDCEEQGIPTLDDTKINKMCEEWNR